MADLQQTIEIIFGAVDNTGQGISSVSNSLNSVVDGASKITGPLSDVADKALKAETSIVAMGAALLTVATNEASRFGEKIEEIGSLVNDTPEQVNALKTSVQDFAGVSNSSNFEQIEKAMYVATSNVGDTAKALDILTIAEKGAVVGATELDSSAALLTRTMNAYGLVTDDSATNIANAERVIAAMFTTVQNGDITMQALADNIGKVSSTASAAGVPIEVIGAAVAALTSAGVGADQSMTLLNDLLKELLSPSDDLSKALGGLSVTANGLPAVMDKLKESTGGSAAKIYDLFSSSEAAKVALILANDSAGKFDGTIKAMDTSVQTFNNNYKNMVGGVADSTIQLENNTKILLQKVGDPLQDGWASILDGLTAIMKGYSLSIDKGAFDPVFTAFNEFDGDISALLKRIGENLPAALEQVDFTGLIASLKDMGFEIGDLFDGIDLSTPEGLAHAIQFLVDTFESLTRVVSGIIDAWGPVVKGFLAGIDTFNQLDDSSKKTIGNVLGVSQVFETLKGTVTGGLSALDVIGKALVVIAGVQAGTGLTSMLAALSGAGLGASALQLGAIGVALYGITTGVNANINAWQDYKARQDLVSDSTSHLADAQGKIKDRLAEISDRTGVTVSSMDELNKAIDEGRLAFDEATGAYVAAGSGVRDYDAEVRAAADSGSWFADAVNDVAKSLGLASDSAKAAEKGFNTLAEAEAYAAKEMADSNNVTITYEKGLWQVHDGLTAITDESKKSGAATKDAALAASEGSKEWKTVQDVLLQTQKQTNDFNIEMAKLTDHKYEIDIRAAVDLQTAQIEADTQRIASAFQSASDVISSLTAGVTDLWTLFAQTDSWDGAREDLKDAAIRQEERLNAELRLKSDLTKSVIAQANATTNRLNSGQPLISIDGGNLAPELELVFDKILKFTQIKASQQGLSMLVGIS